MRIHRRWVLRGYPSLLAADTHVSVGAKERGRDVSAKAPTRAANLRAAIGAPEFIPRPPGLPDDHPSVLGGTCR